MTDISPKQPPRRLLDEARKVSEHAYSPYSGARVGAAVETVDGRMFSGCNVENASYGLTQCAERNALNAAIAAGLRPGEIQSVVIFAHGFRRLTPCGACRQVMIELLHADTPVFCCDDNGHIDHWRVGDLFPYPFALD
jgi:cytidine deaminase